MTRTTTIATMTMAACALAFTPVTQAQSQHGQTDQPATQLDLGDFEDNPSMYIGQEVTVEGEADDVLGPRLFVIDEGNWFDMFDGEALVMVPSQKFAKLRDGDNIKVSGTVRTFDTVRVDIEREWGWFDDPDVELNAELNRRAVIVAETIESLDGDNLLENGAAMSTDRPADPGQPAGMMDDSQPLTDFAVVADAHGTAYVGRTVKLENVTVGQAAEKGYWVGSDSQRLFVLPADTSQTLNEGETVTIHGTVLELPHTMRARIGDDNRNEDIYILARTINTR
jgi:hypothetical protein